jgi:uncharacterized protein (DUF362 family)
VSKVALVKGDNRYDNITQALDLVSDEIEFSRKIVIKPNFTSVTNQLAATHVDAVRAVLDYIKKQTNGQENQEIVVAEGTGNETADSMIGFQNYGFFDLAQHYNVSFIDLNKDETVEVKMLNSRFDTMSIRLAKTVVDAECLISICPPKTHNNVLYTGALKNIASGAVVRKQRWLLSRLFRWVGWMSKLVGDDKLKLHQGYQAMNLNLYQLATIIPPSLSIIDGFEAMQGNGPVQGDKLDLRVAVAGIDFLACDTVASWLMGIDVSKIGYLSYCEQAGLGEADIFGIDILGDKLEDCMMPALPHYKWEEQIDWEVVDHGRYLKWLSALASA